MSGSNGSDKMTNQNGRERRRGGGLREELLRSHLTVAYLGLVMLLLLLVVVIWMRSYAVSLARLRGPTALNSTLALSGVHRSLAGLRGWIVLGDPQFKDERKVAWRDEIEPALGILQSLSHDWAGEQNKRQLAEVTKILADLKESQWWIEDVAQTPGNQPALLVFEREIRPAADIVFAAITALIELERQQEPDRERKLLLASMADFHGKFTHAFADLETFVVSGRTDALRQFEGYFKASRQHLGALVAAKELLTDQQAEQLAVIQEGFSAVDVQAVETIEIRSSDQWNIAQTLLANDAVPRARRAGELLTAMSSDQARQMAEDASWVALISNIATITSLGLIALLAVSAYYVSSRRAKQITQPVAVLAEATGALAAGRQVEDLPITSDNEIGRLTGAFNTMRAALEDSRQALEASEQRMRTVVESAPNGMLIADRQGTIMLVNSEFERMFGYARDELLGRPIEMLVPERIRDKHPEYVAGFFQSPETRSMGAGRELHGVRKGGREFPVEIGLNPFETEDGLFVVAVVLDITERQRKDDELRHYAAELARSNQELDDFAYIASHDLKEPLRGINNYAAFLTEDYEDKLDDEGRHKLHTLQRLCQRLETLINSLLHYSREGRVDLAIDETDVNQLVAEVVDSLHISLAEQGIEVRIPRPLPAVRCDRVRVAEVFRNLIANAMKYTDKDVKWIEVGYRRPTDSAADEDVSAGNDRPRMPPVFYVRDNGIGIREKHLESIFRIFKRLHGRDQYGGGIGAGLTIVKKIVERHGGKIWADSTYGEGTTFYFTLQSEAQHEAMPAHSDR